jgi:hypothetical protein
MALEASIKQNHGIEEKKEVMSGVLKTPNRLHFLPILWFLKLQNLLHQNTLLCIQSILQKHGILPRLQKNTLYPKRA